jgi:hypothetical protein
MCHMNRTLTILAVCAVLIAPATPVVAATQPADVRANPPSYRQGEAPLVTPTINQTATITSPAPGLSRTIGPVLRPQASTGASARQVPTATVTVTGTLPLTVTETVPADDTATVPAVPVTGTGTITPTGVAPIVDESAPDDSAFAGALEGTIIANRTDLDVRFFVEGQTFDLAPLRSLGLPLLRATAVLNLFNCDAGASETNPACFWDPYLLKQDGFYEVVGGDFTLNPTSLTLREAGTPPGDQIWVQNRTGSSESIIVNNEIVELAPATVHEFTVSSDAPVVVNLRNCITQGDQAACEWAPQGVEAGFYYGLVRTEATGANGTLLTNFSLQSVVASSGETVEQPPQANCRLLVPTLNVRGGPGLEFPIVAKIRGTTDEPGVVQVIGYDGTKQWMKVNPRVAPDGWVTANPDFIVCTGDVAALPVEGATATTEPAPEAAPAAEAVPVEPVAAVPVEVPAETATEAVVETPAEAPADTAAPPVEEVATEAAPTEEATPEAAAVIPPGLARIVVNNGFDQVMRFTLDQQYRVERDNLSGEWDLQPGQSIMLLVYPGMIPFTVSTPWRGISGNADFFIDMDQERQLWLYFVPDPDGSGNWILQY